MTLTCHYYSKDHHPVHDSTYGKTPQEAAKKYVAYTKCFDPSGMTSRQIMDRLYDEGVVVWTQISIVHPNVLKRLKSKRA